MIAKLTDEKGLTTNVDVKDCQNGSYTIGYTVQSKEKHALSVYVREKPIHGSPFEVNVIAGIDCEKIGPMLTQFGSGGVISSVKNNDNYEPWGVVCDKDGNILVTDHNNHKVLVSHSCWKFQCCLFLVIYRSIKLFITRAFFVAQ